MARASLSESALELVRFVSGTILLQTSFHILVFVGFVVCFYCILLCLLCEPVFLREYFKFQHLINGSTQCLLCAGTCSKAHLFPGFHG